MAVLPWWDRLNVLPELPGGAPLAVRESSRRRQLVSTILLVVAGFQLVNLPGAMLTRLQKAGREASRAEYENQQLRGEVARLTEALREVRTGKHFT